MRSKSHETLITTEPYYQHRRPSPLALYSGDMRIFAEVFLGPRSDAVVSVLHERIQLYVSRPGVHHMANCGGL